MCGIGIECPFVEQGEPVHPILQVALQKRKLIWYSQGKRAKETCDGRAVPIQMSTTSNLPFFSYVCVHCYFYSISFLPSFCNTILMAVVLQKWWRNQKKHGDRLVVLFSPNCNRLAYFLQHNPRTTTNFSPATCSPTSILIKRHVERWTLKVPSWALCSQFWQNLCYLMRTIHLKNLDKVYVTINKSL